MGSFCVHLHQVDFLQIILIMIVRVMFISRKWSSVQMKVIFHLETKDSKLIGNRLDNYMEAVR